MSSKAAQLLSLTLATIVLSPGAQASLNLIGSGNATGLNLVANGSFETGSPGPGPANERYWATGTPLTPFLIIPSWTGTGQANRFLDVCNG